MYNRLPQKGRDEVSTLLTSSLVEAKDVGVRRGSMSTSTRRDEWSVVVEGIVQDVIKRRASLHMSLDAHDVVEEVMPLAIAAVPQSVRKDLFSKMNELLYPTPQ